MDDCRTILTLGDLGFGDRFRFVRFDTGRTYRVGLPVGLSGFLIAIKPDGFSPSSEYVGHSAQEVERLDDPIGGGA